MPMPYCVHFVDTCGFLSSYERYIVTELYVFTTSRHVLTAFCQLFNIRLYMRGLTWGKD